jgi:hypothetical protein
MCLLTLERLKVTLFRRSLQLSFGHRSSGYVKHDTYSSDTGYGAVESSSAVRGAECWIKGEKGRVWERSISICGTSGNNAEALVTCRRGVIHRAGGLRLFDASVVLSVCLTTFRINVVSSRLKSKSIREQTRCCLRYASDVHDFLFDYENCDSMVLRNVGKLTQRFVAENSHRFKNLKSTMNSSFRLVSKKVTFKILSRVSGNATSN